MVKEADYRLVALDMDGTLLNSAHEVSAHTRAVLKRAAEAGTVVALSTGRCMSELWGHLADNPWIGYVIGENGGCLYDVAGGRMIYHASIDDADVDRVFDAAQDIDVVRQAFVDDQAYMQCRFDESLIPYHIYHFAEVYKAGSKSVDDLYALCRAHRGCVGKINLFFARAADAQRFRRRMSGQNVEISASIGLGLEISPAGASKARGLEALCAHLGIPVERAMAVGDGGNDIDIMRAAGLAVAMGNAIEPVRSQADVITDDCDHDGAARAIERYVLNGAVVGRPA